MLALDNVSEQRDDIGNGGRTRDIAGDACFRPAYDFLDGLIDRQNDDVNVGHEIFEVGGHINAVREAGLEQDHVGPSIAYHPQCIVQSGGYPNPRERTISFDDFGQSFTHEAELCQDHDL